MSNPQRRRQEDGPRDFRTLAGIVVSLIAAALVVWGWWIAWGPP